MQLSTHTFIRYQQSKLPFNFWTETKALNLTNEEKVLLIYLYTSSHTNRLGCFECPTGYMANDLKWSVQIVESILCSLQNYRFLLMDYTSDWIYLTDYLTCFPIKTPSQGKHLEKVFQHVPETCIFYRSLVHSLLQLTHLPHAFRHILKRNHYRVIEKERKERKNGIEEGKFNG